MTAPMAPWFAADEEARAEGLASRVVAIMSDPRNPSASELPIYRYCARLAFETAAAHTGFTAFGIDGEA